MTGFRSAAPNLFTFLFLAAACSGVLAQSEGKIKLDKGDVTAGDKVEMTLTLDQPMPCDSVVWVNYGVGNFTFNFAVSAHKGEVTLTIPGQPPFDAPGGIYLPVNGGLNPCLGYSHSKEFKVPKDAPLTVKALPDKNQYPTSVGITFTLTQRQFFDTKIAELNNLDSQITTRLDKSGVDSPDLRTFLIAILNSALKALDVTESQYRLQIMNSQGVLPAFFADFRKQYRDRLTAVSLPIPPSRAFLRKPSLLDVQLVKRTPDDRKAGRNIAGFYPSEAESTRRIINDNALAYKHVKDTGRITFVARLNSFPTGAHVSFKKLIDDDFKDFSHPTDVETAPLDLATWDFKFQNDDCTDLPIVRRVNPYEDPTPEVSVEFKHCKGKH